MTQPLSKEEKARREAHRHLQQAVTAMYASEEEAQGDREVWEQACLDAFDAGLTYPEIAAISGKSRVRIDQVLRAERIRRGIPINSKGA